MRGRWIGAAALAALVLAPSSFAGAPGTNGLIVFTTNRDGNNEIYVMNADGSSPARLTNNAANDRQPAFSPDGNKIAFTTNRDGNDEIYVINTDGSGLLRVTNNAASDTQPEWTNNGANVVFTTDRDGNLEVYRVPISVGGVVGTEANLTGNAAADFGPEPDGEDFFFTSDRASFNENEIWRFVTSGPGTAHVGNAAQQSTASDSQPDPSSTGMLLYTSARDGNNEVYRRNLFTNADTNLTANAANDSQPAVAPDSTRVVFASTRDQATGELYTMNLDGTSVTRITNNAASDADPDWGPVAGTGSGRWNDCAYGLAQRCLTAFGVTGGGSASNLEVFGFTGGGFTGFQLSRLGAVGNDRWDLTLAPAFLTAATQVDPPNGSSIHIEANLGPVEPLVMVANGVVTNFTRTFNAITGNTISIDIRPWARADLFAGCSLLACGGLSTAADIDFGGYAGIYMGSLPADPGGLTPAELAEWTNFRAALHQGAWVNTNAQVFGINRDTLNNTLEVSLAAPHFRSNGSTLHTGFLVAYLPNDLLTFWGLDRATMTTTDVAVTSTNTGTVSTFTIDKSDPNGVKIVIPTVSYSAPTFDIGRKPAAPSQAPAAPAVAATPADVGVSLAGPVEVAVGDKARYVVTVRNEGPGTATAIRLNMPLPEGLSFVSATPIQGSCYGGVGPVTCELGSLAPGATASVVVLAQATRAGTLEATASVQSYESDPAPWNASSSMRTTVTVPASAPPPVAAPPAVTPPVVTPPAAPVATPKAKPTAKPKPKAQPKKKQAPAKKKAVPKKKAPPKKR